MKLLLIVVSVFLFVACPDGAVDDGPVETCTSVGTKCKMSGGQLGVCTYDQQNLVCLSQH